MLNSTLIPSLKPNYYRNLQKKATTRIKPHTFPNNVLYDAGIFKTAETRAVLILLMLNIMIQLTDVSERIFLKDES